MYMHKEEIKWVEELNRAYGGFDFANEISKGGYENLKDFVQRQVIEKLMADVHTVLLQDSHGQRLEKLGEIRAKWLGEQNNE